MSYPFDGNTRITITKMDPETGRTITSYQHVSDENAINAFYEGCDSTIAPAFISLERYGGYQGWHVVQETFKAADGTFA